MNTIKLFSPLNVETQQQVVALNFLKKQPFSTGFYLFTCCTFIYTY